MVKDDDGEKLLNVKFCDKIIEVVARDGYHLVGSSITEILGSKNTLNVFNSRVRSAQHTGMTRFEVSVLWSPEEILTLPGFNQNLLTLKSSQRTQHDLRRGFEW